MSSEGPQADYKQYFDPESPKAHLDLVKDVVAIANSGGGCIIYGRSDTEVFGLGEDATKSLDRAKVADLVEKYIGPGLVQISHELQKPKEGKTVVVISIAPAAFPLVVSRDGSWRPPGEKFDKTVLRKGDIWVRHSSKNERASYEDVRSWLMTARSSERAAIYERMAMLVNLPEGSSVEVVTKTGSRIDTPSQLIQSALDRRKWDPDHLLSPDDLLWVFSQ
jgi:predicted HTH transcriptional regulator